MREADAGQTRGWGTRGESGAGRWLPGWAVARGRGPGKQSQRPANRVGASECAPKPPSALHPDFAPSLTTVKLQPCRGRGEARSDPERARRSRREQKKSLREPWSVGPPRPPFPVSRPVTGRRLQGRGGRKRRGRSRSGRGAQRRGRERSGFGPNSVHRGPRSPNSAGSGGGGARPWPAGKATSSAGGPRHALSPGGGGKRTCCGLDVDDRAARSRKSLIKLPLFLPQRLQSLTLGRVRGTGEDLRSTSDGPGSRTDPRPTPGTHRPGRAPCRRAAGAEGAPAAGACVARVMASAVFEGTSLVNMFVRGCWVNGIRRLIVSRRGDEEEFFEIRTEWSDRSVLYLHRSFADLGRLWQRLRDAFPEDRPELARAPLRQGLVAIKDAHDIETRLNEVEKLLKAIISMPCKYSRSEVVLTFFERSPLDQVLKNDNVHKIQPSFQSPVKISEIMRSNGFCLANTETIVIDHSIPNGKEQRLGVDPAEHLFENGSEFTSELEDGDDPAAYDTNLSYYHLVPFETDILD